MKVRIVENWQQNKIDVFVFSGATHEGAVASTIERHVDGDVWRTEDVGDVDPWTQRPKPSFSLPIPVLEDVIAQYQRDHTSSDADAVKDARKTRDKMIELVEEVVRAGLPKDFLPETTDP